MSKKYLPFTDEEQRWRVKNAQLGLSIPGPIGILRWDATLRQAETELELVSDDLATKNKAVDNLLDSLAQARDKLTKATAERNAYKRVLNLIVGDDEDLAMIAKSHRHWAKSDKRGDRFHVERAEALEALKLLKEGGG